MPTERFSHMTTTDASDVVGCAFSPYAWILKWVDDTASDLDYADDRRGVYGTVKASVVVAKLWY